MMPRTKSTNMATNSNRRPRVSPMDIGPFGEKILGEFKPAHDRSGYSRYWLIRRIVTFLTQHASVKTTADLKVNLIQELIDHYAIKNDVITSGILYLFRRVCNLAVEWGCLKQSPFEGFEMPKSRPRGPSKARKLDGEQVRTILDYLKDKADTLERIQIYVISSLVLYCGLRKKEALNLKVSDCDLERGVIHVANRENLSYSPFQPDLKIPPVLAGILKEWFQRRSQLIRDWSNSIPYGKRLAEDGRRLIPNEAEQVALANMIKWRSQGWTYKQIAAELDSQGIPTKHGLPKWPANSVRVILIRATKPSVSIDEGYVFPSASGKGSWWDSGLTGHCGNAQLREAGNMIAIEGLTFETLRQFYLSHARPTLDLTWDSQSPRTQPIASEGLAAKPARKCPVELRGEGRSILVYNKPLPDIKGDAYKMLERVVAGFHQGERIPASALAALSESGRIRPLTEALERHGFKSLKRLIRESKEGRNKFLEIVDIGPDPGD